MAGPPIRRTKKVAPKPPPQPAPGSDGSYESDMAIGEAAKENSQTNMNLTGNANPNQTYQDYVDAWHLAHPFALQDNGPGGPNGQPFAQPEQPLSEGDWNAQHTTPEHIYTENQGSYNTGPTAPAGPAQPSLADVMQGLLNGAPTMNGVDMTQPGQNEQWWATHGSQFDQTPLETQLARDTLAKYGNGTQLPASPDLGTYYDDAERRAQEKLDQTMAARGSYGSSYAADQNSDMYAQMEADRAKNEAQYNLQRDQAQRGWLQTLGGLAQGGDNGTLSFLNAASNASHVAQESTRDRGNDAVQNTLAWGKTLSDLLGNYTSGKISADNDILDKETALNLGLPTAGLGDATYNKGMHTNDTSDVNNQVANWWKFGSSLPSLPQKGGDFTPQMTAYDYYSKG